MWVVMRSRPDSNNITLIEVDNVYERAEEAYYREVRLKNRNIKGVKYKNGKLIILPKEELNGTLNGMV